MLVNPIILPFYDEEQIYPYVFMNKTGKMSVIQYDHIKF